MLVRDFMKKPLYTASPTTTIKEILGVLEKHHVGEVPVVDFKGALLGIVTDGDILRFLSPQKEKIYLAYYVSYIDEAETVEDVLSRKVNTPIANLMARRKIKTLSPEDDLENALRTISKNHLQKLPVVNDEGRLVGIISRGDIIRQLSKKTVGIGLTTIS